MAVVPTILIQDFDLLQMADEEAVDAAAMLDKGDDNNMEGAASVADDAEWMTRSQFDQVKKIDFFTPS